MLFVNKLAAMLERLGMWGVVRYVRPFLHPYDFKLYSRELDGVLPEPAPPPGVVFERGNLTRLVSLRSAERNPVLALFRDRTHGLTRFWMALGEGKLAAIAWMSESHPALVLRPDEIALFDMYTHPAFRGRGIGTALILAACQGMRALGYRRVFATVEIRNIPSHRAFTAAGFHLLGRFRCRYLFGKAVQPRPLPVDAGKEGAGSARESLAFEVGGGPKPGRTQEP